jgi:DNA-binding NarL/FixJ family response regulator
VERIRLLLFNEQLLPLEALARALEAEPDFEVLASCRTATETLQAFAGSSADVIVATLDASEPASYDLLGSLQTSGKPSRVLVVSDDPSPDEALHFLRLGVSGILRQNGGVADLVKALRMVAAGEAWLDQKMMHLVADHVLWPGAKKFLSTDREQQVLQGVLDGLTNRRIADRLGTPEGAVKATLRRMFRKAGVRTRGQLIRAALDHSYRTARL